MKRKMFGIAPSLDKGLTDTINMVEGSQKKYYSSIVPIEAIEIDPDNPRRLAISYEEVLDRELLPTGNLEQKRLEWEKLQELSESLTSSDLINPIVIYKFHEKYRIATGERRFLASILAGKKQIEARIFHEKPDLFDLKLMQWAENTEREELSLADRLNNIRDIVSAYLKKHPELVFNSTTIKNITGLSKTQAKYYLSLLNAPDDLLEAIENGSINSLDKANVILSCKDFIQRQKLLKACIQGASLAQLKALLKANLMQDEKSRFTQERAMVVDLGQTTSLVLVKTMIETLISMPKFEQFARLFHLVNWASHKDTSRAFKKLIKLIENGEVSLED